MECSHLNKKYTPRPDTPHHASIHCADCGKFLGWQPAPNPEGIRKQSSKYNVEDVMRHKNYLVKPFCFFCGRTKERLGFSETLTVDHIIPVREEGLDVLTNLNVLCTACHKLRHWAELYLNKHFVEVKA
jgi:hypothetical protein